MALNTELLLFFVNLSSDDSNGDRIESILQISLYYGKIRVNKTAADRPTYNKDIRPEFKNQFRHLQQKEI